MVAEESSAIGDGGQAATSFMSDINGTHIHTFENSKLDGSYVEDLLYCIFNGIILYLYSVLPFIYKCLSHNENQSE